MNHSRSRPDTQFTIGLVYLKHLCAGDVVSVTKRRDKLKLFGISLPNQYQINYIKTETIHLFVQSLRENLICMIFRPIKEA